MAEEGSCDRCLRAEAHAWDVRSCRHRRAIRRHRGEPARLPSARRRGGTVGSGGPSRNRRALGASCAAVLGGIGASERSSSNTVASSAFIRGSSRRTSLLERGLGSRRRRASALAYEVPMGESESSASFSIAAISSAPEPKVRLLAGAPRAPLAMRTSHLASCMHATARRNASSSRSRAAKISTPSVPGSAEAERARRPRNCHASRACHRGRPDTLPRVADSDLAHVPGPRGHWRTRTSAHLASAEHSAVRGRPRAHSGASEIETDSRVGDLQRAGTTVHLYASLAALFRAVVTVAHHGGSMPTVTPFLMFEGQAQQAMDLYTRSPAGQRDPRRGAVRS